jgi:hypothetical protein
LCACSSATLVAQPGAQTRHRLIECTLELDALLNGGVVQALAERRRLVERSPSLIGHEDGPGEGVEEPDLLFRQRTRSGRLASG